MAFLRQLRLLLWKNGLSAIRQPLWSLTLLIWPLFIFIIIAVTRHQFPPIIKDTCYVSPRNLPSAGLFPFLQTLMCNTDSMCRNASKLVDPTESKSSQSKRSSPLENSLLADLIRGKDFFNFSSTSNSSVDPEQLTVFLSKVYSSPFQARLNNVSLDNANTTLHEGQESLHDMLNSVNLVRRALCTLILPIINATSPNHLAYPVVTFCSSNNTVFETSLVTLNQILTELMLTQPDEVMTAAGTTVLMFDQLQNQTSLWETLLAIPQLFSSSSDQVLNSTEALLADLQGVMQVIESNFPTAETSLSNANPLLVGTINTIQYVQTWPGKDVSIPLGEIVTLQNDSLSEMMKRVLQEVQIPLDKAIGLTLDKNIVHSYLCDNSSNPILLSVACSTGTVDMLLGWISPDKAAKQALLAWSKNVASQDLSFIKGIMQSFTGASSPGEQGGSHNARRRRSVDVQPQSIEEELFLAVGEVVMDIIELVPGMDTIVQSILRAGFQSMKSASLVLDTTGEIMANALKDADHLQQTYLTLLTNQTKASIWIDQVLDSVVELALKVLASETLMCEDMLGPFEWLLNTESITTEVWRSVVCRNHSTLQEVLLLDWQPLIQMAQDLYSTFTGQADYNATLPMILEEWQKLINSSLNFQLLFGEVTTELDGEYWMNWMPYSSTLNVTGTLEQSVFLFMETFGENIETSELRPEVKNYFHIVYWILNYSPGVTTQPADCSVNNITFAIQCDTGFNWPQFVQAVTQALMSPNKALVNCLEGTVNLLQHMYGDMCKNLTASYLKQQMKGGDALAAYLNNATFNLDGFIHNASVLPNCNTSDPNCVLPLLGSLLQHTGLTQLLPLFLSDARVNVSTVLDVALKLGKMHQPILTFNKTDPTMLELEQLIMQVLSSDGNLTMPLSHIMASSLLNYTEYLTSDDMAILKEIIRSFNNNNSTGSVEAILSAVELLKAAMDSPNDDPANIILQYIRQLQGLAMSLLKLQKFKHSMLPSGQLSTTQVNLLVKDIIDFLKPESLQNLTWGGPEAVQNIVFQTFVEFLPPSVQQEAAGVLQNFKALEYQMAQCAAGKNCSSGTSDVFAFLNQIVDMISANGNVTFAIAANNSILAESEYEEIASMLFSLFMCPSNATKVQTFNQTLHFINLIMATPNISMSDVENALQQSNLTLDELNDIAALAGAVNVSDLLAEIIDTISALQCLESPQDPMATAQCVVKLYDQISKVLMEMPELHNETAIISLIPVIINRTIEDITHVNFRSNPNIVVIHTLNNTVANVKMNLQRNQLYTPEIMNEINMVQGLIELFGNMEALDEHLNSTLKMDYVYAQKMYLEIVDWYLKRLESITSNSSVSELLQPFFYLTEMEVALQVAQTDFSSFVSGQVEFLVNSLQYPIDGAGLRKISETVTEILQHLFDLINLNVNVQNTISRSELFNTTILNATELQIQQYLNFIQQWMIQPNVSLALTDLLQLGNSSMNVSTDVRDVKQLLETLNNFFSNDQLAYLSVIDNITQSLSNALMLAQQPGGLQSEDFIAAILEAVQSAMQILPDATDPLPVSTQQNIMEIVEDLLEPLVQPGMSFASARNISLFILETAESVIEHTDIPDMFREYLNYGIEEATAYFENIFTSGEPDSWSQMILNEMKTVQSFLPPNSTAQPYVSLLINITQSLILESGQGNMSLWSSFENASVGNMSSIIDEIDKSLNIVWHLAMGGSSSLTTAPSLESFVHLAPVLEEMMTGTADQNTWDSLEKILETLLSSLQGTELWDNISSDIPQFQNIVGSMVNIVEAENEMILSLQTPLLTLMREIAQSVNTSHFNLLDVSERMQLAIEHTANGTLECSEVLAEWEPVRQAAGLTHATMALWCNISLQPLLEASAAAPTVYSHLNITHTGAGPVTVKATAVRIVNTLQSVYQAGVNQTLVTEKLIWAFANQLTVLASQPLSPEAELYWKNQLQDMQLDNSLSSIMQLSDNLVKEAPFLQPYIRAVGNALQYVLKNYHLVQGNSLKQDLFEELAMILASANTTLDNIFSMMWGNLSGLNETSFTDTMREAVKLLSDRKIFGDEPMVYRVLEQLLENNNTCLVLQTLANATFIATERNVTLDTIYSMFLGNSSGLNNTSVTEMIGEAVKLLSDLHTFKDDHMVYQALEQLLTCNDTKCIVAKVTNITTWLISSQVNITSDNLYLMLWGNMSGLNNTSFTDMMREAVKLLSDRKIFGDEPVIYEALLQILTSNDTSVIVQKVSQSTERYFSNQTTPINNIFSMLRRNLSGINETSLTDMMREAVKLLTALQVFGDEPTVYQALEKFLASSDISLNLQKEVKMWSTSTYTNITPDNIVNIMWGDLSGLNGTSFTEKMRETVTMMRYLQMFGNESMVYQSLEQVVTSNDTSFIVQKVAEISAWLVSNKANITSDNIISMMWANLSGLNETNVTEMMRKTVKLLSDLQMLGDKPMIYQGLEKYLTSSNASLLVQKVHEITSWFGSTEANITSDRIFSRMWGNVSGLTETYVSDLMWGAVKLLKDLQILGNAPVVYEGLEKFLAYNNTTSTVQKVAEMSLWLASTEVLGVDLLAQVLPKIYDILRPLISVSTNLGMDTLVDMDLFEELVGNIIAMLRELMGTGSALPPIVQQLGLIQHEMTSSNYTVVTHGSSLPLMLMSSPMNDFIDLFYINYPAMFKAMSEPPSTEEMMETVHMFFANPDLSVVLKGVSSDMPWGLNASQEETINVALGVLSSLTQPDAFQMPPLELLANAAHMLPDGSPFSSVLKDFTKALANESQEILILLHQTIQIATELPKINLTDPEFTDLLNQLRSQICVLENMESVRLLTQSLSMEPGQLCYTFLPSLQVLVETVLMNVTSLTDAFFAAIFGDPSTYTFQPTWTTVLTQNLNFNISGISKTFNINITSSGVVTIGDLLRNKTAFVLDVQKRVGFKSAFLNLLMETSLPAKNFEILSWLIDLRHCKSATLVDMNESDVVIFETFCSMSVEQWYTFSLLMFQHLNMEEVIYNMVLSEELQTTVEFLLQMATIITDTMNKILPPIGQLQNYLLKIQDFGLVMDNELKQMTRGRRSVSSSSTFDTLSRAMCSNGIGALFGISKLPLSSESDPSSSNTKEREELIKRFKIPQNPTPFCKSLYLDMVSTTGGAIAWAFLKPLLMGKILFTPDTPVTRAIMEKANVTLQEFATLRKNSEDWIQTSNSIIKSAEILGYTLPMLKNLLGNSFVKNFIEIQTGINVDRMKETLSSFSNMTALLEQNRHLMDQITTLSNLMVELSSCVTFDRYQGYNSEDELNVVAQELAKNRDLFASVIFKFSQDQGSSTNRPARSLSASSASSLPPKVSYTIRMHLDNVRRTDRIRDPLFIKDNHISFKKSIRYDRGFIYIQETIDRAITEAQVGQKITGPAVQLQPFPYPCHPRDEFLQGISFVFPLMLMVAWLLFVAEFVKKLVHERELRLHEYMKMMGVNPLSHFFAWFLECAAYLVLTIFMLTLVLKYGKILPNSDGFILFLYLCDYGLSVIAFSFLISSFFDKTYIAGLSGSLIYIFCFFPFIMVMALETSLTFSQKSALSVFAPACFSYASQYVSRYETQGEGIHWSNSYTSPIAGDTASFGWLCWMMLIDSILYFIIGAYVRMVFPGKYGIPAPWYFPFKASFWTDLCCCVRSKSTVGKGLLFTNIMQKNQPVFSDDKGKGQSTLSSQAGEDFSDLPVGVALHGLSKIYGSRVGIENVNMSFYEGHVTSLLGHNGAGKTTTMSLLTGLYPPSSGTVEVYGKDMQTNTDDIRKELGVCMQYDVLFDHMTTKEHLLLYGQIKAPHWTPGELREQVRTILEETGMHAHRHKLVGTLSGGMKRKLSISIAFIGGSRLVILDEPTTGVDPCSRRSIWDMVIQHKKHRTVIMSTHHLDEAEVLSDRIAFLERGGLKCCGSPFYLKDKLGQGYKLTLTKKMKNLESEQTDNAELKAFIQAHVPEARLKEAQGGDLVYSLPPFTSSNASSYRSLLTALDSNLDALQLGGYGITDTTLEEVFLQLTEGNSGAEDSPLSISETVSDTSSIDSFPSDLSDCISSYGDRIKLSSSSMVQGMALAWQQVAAILIKRFHHNRRDWKGLIAQILLPVLFVTFAMGLGSLRNNLQNYPELELSPALYNIQPSYSFFRNLNPNSSQLVDAMTSFPGIDNTCLQNSDDPVCKISGNNWTSSGTSPKPFSICKCTPQEQICERNNYQPPHKQIPSSQIVYNITGIKMEDYLIATANDFIRNRYGGFDFGLPLPSDLQMDLQAVPLNRTLSKVWFNPEGHHTMPAYLNSLNNFILRANLPADKDPSKYAISVSSHPYFARADDEDVVIQGMLQIIVAMCVLTGYSITTASFAIYEVNEHHSGSKRLQHISGVSEPLYWAVNYLYDMAIYMIPVTLTVGVIAAFQIPAYTDQLNLAAVALLLVLFGFATFPWMYLLAGVFKDAEMAFITYVCINLFISVNTITATSIPYFLSQITTHHPEVFKDLFEKLSKAFLIFPQFNFGNGLMLLARINIEVQILSGYGVDAYKNPFSTDALGWMFISSFIQGLVFITLRLLLNKFLLRKIRHLTCGRKTVPHVPCEDEDEDVAAEHLRVSSGAANSNILQVNQLTKVYQHFKKKIYAVKRISVGIPAGECFGLLGVNGAGKTTTFKMLTGDVSPTDGTAQIKDWDGHLVDIMECRNKGINIGYCPQVDALDDLLTGEEHLYFYARIRGISKRDIDGVVNYLLKKLQLNYHRKIVTDSYSCGTRRKLSTALALVGNPQILLLDEPSSGMDPRTKRHLWKIISEEVKGKCAVVLTSHSMEECEALCSRLAIMVKGQFQCLGSLQHIKNRFGSGFTVKMYLAEASCDAGAITAFMQRRFPSTYLKDQHSNMVEYHVAIAPGGVADIFDQLESNKNALQIKHFSVSQTTLDEVFINFAMGKAGMETIPIHGEDECDNLGSVRAMET